ncbi:heparin lyase I family protein [Streptomyces sp. NPDC090032]|uniref:heparin lyase I family protein n=1 Tax=unclassified Streptomyces TaxID=2593676 RepID=UPI003724AB01
MQSRMLRFIPRAVRGRLYPLAAGAAAMMLVTATPAHASVIWDGDASHGTGVFAGILCDAPNYTYTTDWGDGHGDILGLVNKAGGTRCEAHSVKVGGSEYAFTSGKAYWWGWDSMTSTGNTGTVFQWKSNGTGEQHQQNYPVIMMVLENQLRVWYVAPGEQWIGVGSGAWAPETWHKIKLGINAQSGTTGSFQVYLDGNLIVDQQNVRTWDDLGNKPRWGVYDSNVADTDQVNWINGLKMGTTSGDV